MTPHPRRRWLALSTLLCAAALGACATAPGSGLPRSPDAWAEPSRQVEELLLAGRYEEAHPLAAALVAEMAQGLGSGPAATSAMGYAVAQLALAEAGLGRKDDALWHWSVADSLRPERDLDGLARYGAAGAFLSERCADWIPEEAGSESAAAAQADGAPPIVRYEDMQGEDVVAPVKQATPQPQSTAALRALKQPERVIVQTTITREGRVRNPRVVDHRYPGFAFVVTEELRDVRFSPASVAGEAVEVLYHLTIQLGHR